MPEIIAGAQIIAQVLKEEGVEAVFGVLGGQLFNVLHAAGELGIKVYHMRSEYSAGFAADAYARCRRQAAVTFSGGSPGITNMMSPIAHAQMALSPVVGLVAQHAMPLDKMRAGQEFDAVSAFKGMTKWSYLCSEWNLIAYWLRKAFRDSLLYPQGPVVVSYPANVILNRDEKGKQLRDPLPHLRPPQPGRTQGDPDLVEKAAYRLSNAERPLIIAGDAVFWSDAGRELRELAELLQCPVHTRRMARGIVPEDHPLAFTGGNRQPLLDQADVILLIGLQASQLEEWFEPPVWNHQARYIQVHEVPEAFFVTPPTEVAIVGCTQLVLKQMIDFTRMADSPPVEKTGWLNLLSETREAYGRQSRERAERWRNSKLIHPDILSQEIVDFLDPGATLILDSFTVSPGLTDRIQAKFAGQVLDTALHQSVGHGIGMAVGAQLARPGKQILVVIGDGGLGITGMDIESLVRWNLPVVVVVFNNSSWGGVGISQKLFWSKSDPWDMIPGIRYDKMYQVLGCHTEQVEEVKDIRPALERAFNSGMTSVINVVGDARTPHPFIQMIALWCVWSRGGVELLPEEARKQLQKIPPRLIRRVHLRLRSMGLFIPLEELARICGKSLEQV